MNKNVKPRSGEPINNRVFYNCEGLRLLDVYDIIYLTLAANGNQIKGRTTIHKLIYFEMQKIPELNIESHIAYFYGPFNIQVAQGLETLVYLGALDERRSRKDNSYEYAILKERILTSERLIEDNKEIYEKIKDIVQTCSEYCNLNANSLSFAAKVHYMLSKQERKKGMTEKEASDMATKFGWSITKKDVKSGAELLRELNLVKIKR